MTPAARIQAAIEVLDAWAAGAPVEQVLTRWARASRYAGSKDRAAVRNHVYDALRNLGHAQHLGQGASGRAVMIGLLRLQGADPKDLFTGEGHAPTRLSNLEAAEPPGRPDFDADMPPWLRPKLEQVYGDQYHDLVTRFSARAPLYLRVNALKAQRETAQAALARDGIVTEAHPSVATALTVLEGERKLRSASTYLQGLVEVQDLSVQAALLACPWPERGTILDYCAGGGGKTLGIAPLTKAKMFAHDAEPRRMSDLPIRAKRAGVKVKIATERDLTKARSFTTVLCDVPCSGSGTWRRDPEAKWRLTQDGLRKLQDQQDAILNNASKLVEAGGQLIYMTCSMFDEENEARIAAFLAQNCAWQITHQSRSSPLTLSDGFYHCVLKHVNNA